MSTEPAVRLLALCDNQPPVAATIVPVHLLAAVCRDALTYARLVPLIASLPDDGYSDADLDALEQARSIVAEAQS